MTAGRRDDPKRSAGPDRREQILEGARSAFLRFGFDRTSLADIAAGAGVSRTAFYHYFPGKEDVLRAVVDDHHAESLRRAKAVAAEAKTLADALEGLFQAKFGRLLEPMGGSQHGVELVDATHRLTGAATRIADGVFQDLVASTLAQHGRANDAVATADAAVAAAKGLMRSGDLLVSKPIFDARLQRLISWITA